MRRGGGGGRTRTDKALDLGVDSLDLLALLDEALLAVWGRDGEPVLLRVGPVCSMPRRVSGWWGKGQEIIGFWPSSVLISET